MPSPTSPPSAPLALAHVPPALSPKTQDFLSLFFNPIFTAVPETPAAANDDGNYVLQFKHLSPEFLSLNTVENGYGLFVSVNSFLSPKTSPERPKRDQAHLSHLNLLYCDIDAPKGSDEATVSTFKTSIYQLLKQVDPLFPLTALVETKNGYHCYWKLLPPIPVHKDVTDTNTYDPATISKALEDYLTALTNIRNVLQGDDQAKDLTRVLRIPDTFHLKDPNTPFVTRLRAVRKNGYTLADALRLSTELLTKQDKHLDDYLQSEINKYANPKQGVWPISPNETPVLFQRANAGDVPATIKDEAFKRAKEYLDQEYPKKDRPSIQALSTQPAAPGSRNISLLVLASAYRESGVSQAEFTSLFPDFWGLPKREIALTIKSAYSAPKPYDFAWNHPVLAPLVSADERSRTITLVSSFMSEYFNQWRAEQKRAGNSQKSVGVVPGSVAAQENPAPIVSTKPISVDEEKVKAKELKKIFSHFADYFFNEHPYFYSLNGKVGLDFVDGGHHVIHVDELEIMVRALMQKLKLDDFMSRGRIGDLMENVLKDMRRYMKEDEDFQREHAFWIPAKNGLINVEELNPTIMPYQPDKYVSPSFSVAFNQAKYDAAKAGEPMAFRDFLLSLASGNGEVAHFLEEVMGYCLTTSVEAEKSFILYGAGANGKSTFVNVLQTILGPQFASSLTLSDLKNSFMVTRLYMKRMNVVDEVSSGYFESDMFKRIVTGNRVMADRKFLDPIEFRPCAKIVFAVNHLPKVNDQSEGFFRRVITIPFKNHFKPNPEFSRHIASKDMLEEALAIAIVGLQRWIARGKHFVVPPILDEKLQDYRESNSPILTFLSHEFTGDQSAEEAAFDVLRIPQVYCQYRKFCVDYGYQSKSITSFIHELENISSPRFPFLHINKPLILGLKPRNATPFISPHF